SVTKSIRMEFSVHTGELERAPLAGATTVRQFVSLTGGLHPAIGSNGDGQNSERDLSGVGLVHRVLQVQKIASRLLQRMSSADRGCMRSQILRVPTLNDRESPGGDATRSFAPDIRAPPPSEIALESNTNQPERLHLVPGHRAEYPQSKLPASSGPVAWSCSGPSAADY